MIVFRYLAREVFTTLIAITAILVLIFLSNQLVHYLAKAAAGKLSGKLLLHLLLLQIPHLLGLLLPLGLFLAILLVYGRMYVDNEMTVLFASGMTPLRLMGMTLALASGAMLIVAALNLWLSPVVTRDIANLMKQAKSAAIVELLIPGQFRESSDGRTIYYAQKISRDREHMYGLFMAQQQQDDPEHWTVMFAREGKIAIDPQDNQRYLVVSDGARYIGQPGMKDYRVVQFDSYHLPLRDEQETVGHYDEETLSTLQLIQQANDDNRVAAELQWRIAMPISLLLLALLAVPLSYIRPRHGKYAKILPAMLVYTVYANLLFVGRDWIQHGIISKQLGMWWIHGGLLLFTLAVLNNQRLRLLLRRKPWQRQVS
ncbi:MAG: LPS export ABC transporter permease LptF [Gammaproteobacteria bacterium]